MPPSPRPDPRVAALFDRADEALDRGETEQALALARELEALLPGSAEVVLLVVDAQREAGRFEEAERILAAARERSPRELSLIHAQVEGWVRGADEDRAQLEQGLVLAQRAVKLARKAGDLDAELAFLVLQGVAHNQLGESGAALQILDAALALNPTDVEAKLERALALFELCRFADAQTALERLVREVPEEPWVHHTLGLLAERRRDDVAARKHFAQARTLAPEEFPDAIQLGEEAFDRALEDALGRLPEAARAALENTPVAVEDFPSDEDLRAASPPLSPTILGLFRGQALPHRELLSPADHFPASIILYQRNLERFARSREELLEQIGITVMHEVGHLLGLDEDDLWERGLD